MIALRRILFADYGQFYVQDAEAHSRAMRAGAAGDPNRAAGGWDGEAVRFHRIGLEPHSLSVGTARADVVEAALAVHPRLPDLAGDAEHVVEADLDVVTGTLVLVGCTEPRELEHSVAVVPGRYRARVSYVPSTLPEESDPDEPGDCFRYEVDLWPAAEPSALAVVRQGAWPWAD